MSSMPTDKTTHIERTAQKPRNQDIYEVTLNKIDQINEKIRLFRLDLPASGAKFLPGQWLDVYVPSTPNPGGFTITSPPSSAQPSGNQNPYLELAIQESPSNPPAAFLFRPAASILGSTLRVRIGGSFTFPSTRHAATARLNKVVFVAGGMGINPLMSMLSYMAEGGWEDVEGRLLYGVRLPKEGRNGILFLERILQIFQKKLKGNLQLFVSRSEGFVEALGGFPLKVHHRRMTLDDVNTAVGVTAQDKASTIIYVCGPPTMTDELVEHLVSKDGAGLDANRVLTEKWW